MNGKNVNKTDYKKTLHLPQTDFPMKGGLPELEPKILASWKSDRLYQRIQEQGKKSPKRFILHDGPPYANGHVHLGTALNKILKDVIVKAHTMMGEQAPYVPGWDCHGMPIEHNVIKDLSGQAAKLSKIEIRRRCREFAGKYLDIQREEFQRLGCLGDWQQPYVTMSKQYEAEIVGALGDLVRAGYIYRGLRPIHWCATCQTALAEAELEYHEHSSPSIFVKFPIRDADPVLASLGSALPKASVLIWTTTPWTIPANLAIALHPEFDYVFAQFDKDVLLVAQALLPAVSQAIRQGEPRVLLPLKGKSLAGMKCRHPMFDRDSVIILADYVTLDAGTGCVHTAPGHGAEDFESGKKYGLPIFSPVNEQGRFTQEVPGYQGRTVFESNGPISDQLQREGFLLGRQEISHSYPFCWRCKQPLIFRATEQWFVNVEHQGLRQKALDEINRVRWIPAWGHQRISNMVQSRPDWCLSRQRVWGVPIPAVCCRGCDKVWLMPAVIDHVQSLVAQHGADVWFERPLAELLPPGFACPTCGGKDFDKEEDILDVWFDSSCSQRAVLEHRPELSWPCDLYLEATDQHRGWFQVSLLTAVATRGAAPFHQVLTHGLILDESSKKMSKSLGNVIAPEEVISKYGADVLRLLFASVDYTADICFTHDMLGPMSDAYRKIRNTIRFILGNISDFDPALHAVPEARQDEIDRWMRARMRQAVQRVLLAYQQYEFHVIHHTLLDLCTVELSAFYLDVIKDRLYVLAQNDPSRRSAQTTLVSVGRDLLTLMAPILSFTTEEAWSYLHKNQKDAASIHLTRFPGGEPEAGDEALLQRWSQLRLHRGEINKALEDARKSGAIGSNLDARLLLKAPPQTLEFLQSFGADLIDVLKVASVDFVQTLDGPAFSSTEVEGLAVLVQTATDQKCGRCWNRRPEVGKEAAHPDLCHRCAQVLAQTSNH